jgi:hypothetical protein
MLGHLEDSLTELEWAVGTVGRKSAGKKAAAPRRKRAAATSPKPVRGS